MSAGRFKASYLAALSRVVETGELVVTKRGRPVAEIVPLRNRRARPLRGSVVFRGDVVGPILGEWEIGR